MALTRGPALRRRPPPDADIAPRSHARPHPPGAAQLVHPPDPAAPPGAGPPVPPAGEGPPVPPAGHGPPLAGPPADAARPGPVWLVGPVVAVVAVTALVLGLVMERAQHPQPPAPAATAAAAGSTGAAVGPVRAGSGSVPAASTTAPALGGAPVTPSADGAAAPVPAGTPTSAARTVRVAVLDSGRRLTRARSAADRVAALGWPLGLVGVWTGRHAATTTVYFPPGQDSAAGLLAADLGGLPTAAYLPGMDSGALVVVLTGPLG